MNISTRQTKIVATIGPASADKKVLGAMIESGMNVARINFSHGEHATHRANIEAVRQAANVRRIPVAILQDLSGPKIRIGDFADNVEFITLKKGSTLVLTTNSILGDEERLYVNYKNLPKEVRPGMRLLLDDGKISLTVTKVWRNEIHTIILDGGTIRSRRGLNAPDSSLSISALTAKDKKDLEFGIAMNVDFVALSFVRSAGDIIQLQKILTEKKSNAKIIAKIETRGAMDNIDEIISLAGGIMIARGDLAVEIPREEVPLAQKMIIQKCIAAGKPVITATQMLDSMTTQSSPTRAEVNDVANAIFDGTDAVMLSQETAVGDDPAHVIRVMSDIAHTTERSELYRHTNERREREVIGTVDAVSMAVSVIAHQVGAHVIVALTESGFTPRMVSRQKPSAPILALTTSKTTYQQLALSWGCIPLIIGGVKDMNDALRVVRKTLRETKLAKPGETFVLAAGTPFGITGGTNSLVVYVM